MEACLRIPTHLLLANGRSRAIARRAFAHLLPSQILERSWKGTSDALIKFALHKQRPQIRDYLLGGYLAEHHLIDRVAVDACLSGEVTTKDFEYHQFLDFLTIESWARSVR
jgi:asparagine synthase (glutamine-hydrolysing)